MLRNADNLFGKLEENRVFGRGDKDLHWIIIKYVL
jgi:hypothetical protein